ncbi:MAG: lipid-A-disaccharide synthase [Steroidobacteraceae bacterium]|jgi:lipid-A-disaccharide synthase
MSGLRVAICAGETSGDLLGAALMQALRACAPDIEFCGVPGPRMRAAGCEALAGIEELSVMGLFELLPHLPRLLSLRARLARELIAWKPDVFIGVDYPGFNLGLAARLKARGIRTVQYVSPQVWAWRQGRVRTMARTLDLVLCLLPFEPAFYARHKVRAEFIGHPLADQIPLASQLAAARATLGLASAAEVVALLPGSRLAEIERLGPEFLTAARWLRERRPNLTLIAPMASPVAHQAFSALGAEEAGVRLLDGQARLALQAADVGLVTSGTATLEALLCGCPMVVAYRASRVSAWLVRTFKLVRLPYFSLPNLLANEALVPEFLQEQVKGAALGAAVLEQLEHPEQAAQRRARFAEIHAQLQQDGAKRAAEHILALLDGAAIGAKH